MTSHKARVAFRDKGLISCQQHKEAIITITNICSYKAQKLGRGGTGGERKPATALPLPKILVSDMSSQAMGDPKHCAVIPQCIALAPGFSMIKMISYVELIWTC